MSLIINGSQPTIEKVLYNGVDLEKIIFNGVTVWEKEAKEVGVLDDFTYTENTTAGTKTITGWRGTYQGTSSTKCIVPDDPNIIF